jgi:hypothetical protein
MRRSMLVLAVGLLVTACQTTPPVGKSVGLDDNTFMGLWETYRHCERGIDLEAMQVAARHLSHAAYHSSTIKTIELPLPKAIHHWVSDPPSRLAVDPKSMAAACSLYTGHAALSAGRNDLAEEMFLAVLKNPASTPTYYIEQARAGLAQATIGAHASSLSEQPTELVALSARK